jgi:hypothetical protein
MGGMLASFGFPTSTDYEPLVIMALLAVWFFCRDATGRLTNTGRIGLLVVVVFWALSQW